MNKIFLSLAAMAGAVTLFATPASATNGQEALDRCTVNCSVLVDDAGGIVISVEPIGGGATTWIYCPSRTEQCEVVRRAPTRNMRGNANVGGVAGVSTGATSTRPAIVRRLPSIHFSPRR